VLIFTGIHELKAFVSSRKSQGQTIGFVPTMGALHAGHISLLNCSKKDCQVSICSIFVNPSQFNDKKDLERYPRTPQADTRLLEEAGCDAVFMPSVEEIYPEKDERVFDFGYLDKILEGAHRPGHFNGVAQVVSRLFDIVEPHRAYFGNKDYQQVMIIKALVKMLKLDIDVIACPTLREQDGLAMSSRNTLLSAEERKAASIIPQLMQEAKLLKGKGKSVSEIKNFVTEKLSANSIYRLDYFAICDSETLKEIRSFDEARVPIALIACLVGKIRLIDNLTL
jgi:pantoate--beta-alanine ligase